MSLFKSIKRLRKFSLNQQGIIHILPLFLLFISIIGVIFYLNQNDLKQYVLSKFGLDPYKVSAVTSLSIGNNTHIDDLTPTSSYGINNYIVKNDGSSNVYYFWREYVSLDSSSPVKVKLRKSADNGKTFTSAPVDIPSPSNAQLLAEENKACADNRGNVYLLRQYNLQPSTDMHIYLNRSSDYGATWQAQDTQIDHIPSGFNHSPEAEIFCDNNGNVYVVWMDERNHPNTPDYSINNVFFNRSSDYGASWQPEDTRIDTTDAPLGNYPLPQVVSDNSGHVYVVWTNTIQAGQYYRDHIYFKVSQNYGASWSSEYKLDTGPLDKSADQPVISADNQGHVYVIWRDLRSGSYQVYFNRSSDYGATWQSSDQRVDRSPTGYVHATLPQMTSDNNGNVYVVYNYGVNPNINVSKLFLNKSSDYGATWQESDINIDKSAGDTNDERFAQIATTNEGIVFVTWVHQPYLSSCSTLVFPHIYYNYSLDFGNNWQTNSMRLDTGSDQSVQKYPMLSSNENNFYIGWRDGRDTNEVGGTSSTGAGECDLGSKYHFYGITAFIGIGSTSPTPTPTPTLTPTPTPTPTPDITLPSVSITKPLNNSLVSGLFDIDAIASDDVGVTKVEFLVNNTMIGTDSSAPFGVTWDARGEIVDSTHNLVAKASDAAGNIATSSAVRVTIADTTSPTAPANLHSTSVSYNAVSIAWDVSTDNKVVVGYSVIRDGVTIGQTPETAYVDTSVNAKTTYNYNVIAYDAAENSSTSSNTLTVTTSDLPDTTPPISPTSLVATAVSDTQINLSWNQSTDNVSVSRYEIYRENALIASISSVDTSFGDINLSPTTQYSYYVIAADAANNKSAPSNIATATTLETPIRNGAITGTITSSAGGVISGAKVTLKIGKTTRTAYTNSSGVYGIGNIPPGNYSVTYSAKLYITKSQSVTIPNGTAVVKNVTLQRR